MMKTFINDIKEFIESVIPDLKQNKFIASYNEEKETLLVNESAKYIDSFSVLKKVYSEESCISFLNNKLFLYLAMRTILESKGYSKGLAHYYSFELSKLFMDEDIKEVNEKMNITDLALIDDISIEQMKIKSKLTVNLLKLSAGLDLKTYKSDKYIETIELAKQLISLNVKTTNTTPKNKIKSPKIEEKANMNVLESNSEDQVMEMLEEYPDNYIDNVGSITTGSYEISELYRHFSNKNAPKELFLVDKLEISLAHYASNYKKNCDNYWETFKFDANFFNDFIPGDLLTEFNIALHEHIKPLNSQEINRYLTTSINQFKTHTPDKRKDVFCEIYHDVYWYPNYMKYTGSSARDNYVLHVWKLFSNYFQLFQEATQNTFDIFKASLTTGSTRTIHEVENVNSIRENKSEILKSNLSRNGFLDILKVKSLSHDSKLKLIEMISLNDTPFNVALFDYIGFIKFLEFEMSLSKVAIYKKISEILNCSADTIKGNVLSLNEYSKIDKDRYTAHLHKEKVKNDYNSLK